MSNQIFITDISYDINNSYFLIHCSDNNHFPINSDTFYKMKSINDVIKYSYDGYKDILFCNIDFSHIFN